MQTKNQHIAKCKSCYTPSGKNIEMDFSWYLGLPAMTRDVLVAGVYKPNLNNPRLFQNGDVYRIWRNNGNVEFYVNGLLDGTFPDKYPDRPMYLEAVFYDVNKKVENLYIYKEVLKTHDTIQTTEMVAKVDGYKYGFQGQEKDDEVKGRGNSVNYTFRMHDPRIGRFFAVDPLTHEYPHYTPYSFSGNKLISHREREGLEEEALAAFAGPPGWLYIAAKWTIIGIVTYYTVEATVDHFKNAPALPEAKRTVEGQPAPANAPRDDTKGKPEPKPEPKPIVPAPGPTTDEKKKDDPKYIYRGGSNTDKNYTPRESDLESSKYPLKGLSFATTPEQATQYKGGKAQKVSVDALRKQGMTVVFDGNGHVTVTTTSDNNLKRWASSRNELLEGVLGQVKSHYLTRKVASSRVGEVKLPKT